MPKFMDQENSVEGRWEFMAKAEWKDTFDFFTLDLIITT